jgi:hypothetical protein
VEYLFDILQKIGGLNFLWIEAVGDLRAANLGSQNYRSLRLANTSYLISALSA